MSAVDWQTFWAQDMEHLDEQAAYQKVAWVRRCVEMRSNAMSAIPTRVFRGQDEVEWDFSSIMPSLLWLTEASLQLYGCAYWIRERNRVKDRGYRWLLPSTITPKYTRNGLDYFERRVNGELIRLEPDELLYVWAPSLTQEIGPGPGWVSTVLTESQISDFANTYAQGFFERGAVPLVLLSVDGNPARSELDRLESWWRRMLQGIRSAWETVAVRASVKPQVIGFPLGQLAMPELMGVVRQQIAVAAGVPQTMLEDAANYATAVEHRRSFYDETIVPEALLIETALNRQLFEPQGLRVSLDYQSLDLYQEDEAARASSLMQMTRAGLPVDLAMEILGFELPSEMTYDDLRARLQESRANNGPPALAASNGGLETEREAELRQWRRYAGKRSGAEAAKFVCRALSDDVATVIRHRLILAETPEEVKAAFSGPFLTIKERRVTEDGQPDPLEGAKNEAERRLWRLLQRRFGEQWRRILDALGDPPDLSRLDAEFWDAEDREMLSGLRQELEGLALTAAQDLMETAHLGISWELVAESAARWASEYAFDLVRSINDTTRRVLSERIPAFFRESMTREQLEQSLAPWFGPVRASRIAVTEVTRAAAEGQRAGMAEGQRIGYRMVPIWHTNRDDLVCPICRPRDGAEILDNVYPPAHVNCRCWIGHRMEFA